MAHEIDQSSGRAAMFAAGTPPWHGLGINVQEAQDSQKAIQLAGLDWDIFQCRHRVR